jgi:redox-sensitive bicupin YhaK (pirin superfamily)
MSNLETEPHETVCAGRPAADPVRELHVGRDVVLGGPRGLPVTRTLPGRDRRMVGAWCFLDAYGPADLTGRTGMLVPPHPHTGLQTVSWLVSGEVLHRDSLGSEQLIRPGQLNLMTAGRAIAHSEETPAEHSRVQHRRVQPSAPHSPVLQGVQLWVALPEPYRRVEPHFEHHPGLPVYVDGGASVTVLMGEFAGAASPAQTYSPLVGADATLLAGSDARLPLEPGFEYAALALSGRVEVDGLPLTPGPLLYLGSGRSHLAVRAERPARLLLLGGEPFEEEIVMWWNFVARSHEEIVADREDWMAGRRFGTVPGFNGPPLPAPEMPVTRLRPRGRSRE